MNRRLFAGIVALSLACAGGAVYAKKTPKEVDDKEKEEATELVHTVLETLPSEDNKTRYSSLTDADFKIVAKRLGVEVAAIKAVVEIEAGPKMTGFWAPGVPVVNFDSSMWNRYVNKCKSKGDKSAKVPSGLKGQHLTAWTRLTNARKTNVDAANMATFWGMFQIGGFNYAKCGCSSVAEMVRLMCHSELEQLELFASFIINSGMVNDLKRKDWAAFARKYNGSSYASRGYHTKMAKAYAKFKNQ